MNKTRIALLAIAALAAGCVLPPRNVVKLFHPQTGRPIAEYSSRKNLEIVGWSSGEAGTNGMPIVKFERLSSVNDPAVISKTASGQALIIREVGSQVLEGVKAGATGGAGALVGP